MRLQWIVGRIVLLYQMPKTGSQTLQATLRSAPLPIPVLRTHFLSQQNIKELRAGLASPNTDSRWKQDAQEQLTLISKLSRALRLRKLLLACGVPIPRVLVISAVRDVFGTALSSIFENHRLLVPNLECLTPEKCRDLLSHPALCGQFQNWFDFELKANFAIDVYGVSFPTKTGHVILQNRLARALVYRFDYLPRMRPFLEKYLGHSIPSFVNVNLSRGKEYARQYDQAKRRVCLSEEVVTRELDSKLMRHFFSSQERTELAEHWERLEPIAAD
jgi:hypothetical protein